LKNAAEQIKAVAAAAAGQGHTPNGSGDVGSIGGLLETSNQQICLFNQQMSAQKLAQLAGLGNNYQQYFANEAMKQLAAAAKASNEQRSSPGAMSPNNQQNGKRSPSLSPAGHNNRSESDLSHSQNDRNREKQEDIQRNFNFPNDFGASHDKDTRDSVASFLQKQGLAREREAIERSLAEKIKMSTTSTSQNVETAAQAAFLKQITTDLAGRGFAPPPAGLAGLLDQNRFRRGPEEEKYTDAGFFSDLARLIPDSEESILPLVRKFQGHPNQQSPVSPRFLSDFRMPVLSRPPSADHILRNGSASPRGSRASDARSPSPKFRESPRDRSSPRDRFSPRDRSPVRDRMSPREPLSPRMSPRERGSLSEEAKSPAPERTEKSSDEAAEPQNESTKEQQGEPRDGADRCGCTSKVQLRDLRANVLELITMLVPDFDLGENGDEIDLNSSKVDDLITEVITGVSTK
jgi:hypothetical protein